jgi:hypothetical protein
MAYQSSVAEPFLLSWPALAGPIVGAPNVAGSSVNAQRPRIWSYLSTADALTTVTATSYFSDGYYRGMRPGDMVVVVNSTSTTSSTGVTATWAAVTAYTSSTGGVNLTTGAFQN